MHIIKITIAIAAAACLGLMPVHAAERGDSSGARSKQLSSTRRTSSTDGGRISKTSRNRITRSHTSNRKSNAARRNHDRQRSAKSPDATRTVNDIQPSDVNVQVELPTR